MDKKLLGVMNSYRERHFADIDEIISLQKLLADCQTLIWAYARKEDGTGAFYCPCCGVAEVNDHNANCNVGDTLAQIDAKLREAKIDYVEEK
jgi:hypothetical protein